MSGKWTAGPWRVGPTGHVMGSRVSPVALICHGGEFRTRASEVIANTALILAAPTMADAIAAHLSARKALQDANVNGLNPDDPRFKAANDTVAALEAALSLARGEQ